MLPVHLVFMLRRPQPPWKPHQKLELESQPVPFLVPGQIFSQKAQKIAPGYQSARVILLPWLSKHLSSKECRTLGIPLAYWKRFIFHQSDTESWNCG